MKNILVINAGSSSLKLKYQLIDIDTETVIAKGLCERIGIDGSMLTYKPANGDKVEIQKDMPNHEVAIKLVLDILTDAKVGVIKDMSEIAAVGHRMVHGGEKFSGSVRIDDAVIEAMKECIPLGPLHNPANLMGIAGCQAALPNTPMVGVFDTAWGQGMEPSHFMYALPYELYKQYGVRRYGFHGTSHKYVTGRALKLLDDPNAKLHLLLRGRQVRGHLHGPHAPGRPAHGHPLRQHRPRHPALPHEADEHHRRRDGHHHEQEERHAGHLRRVLRLP